MTSTQRGRAAPVRLAALLGLLFTCLLVAPAFAASITAVTVSGSNLQADGRIFVPRGVNIVAFVAPPGRQADRYQAAARRWGAQELAAIKAYGADTIRFNVSQPGLDPQSPIYSAAFRESVLRAVRQTRAAGFAVILSMQWEKQSGLAGQSSLPDAATARAWDSLKPVWLHDQGVMLELLNEPRPPRIGRGPRGIDWQAWVTSFQPLIDHLRAGGAQNVLIVDGAITRLDMQAVQALRDPLRRLAFAVHPYLYGRRPGPQLWDRLWGRIARQVPVLVTEWNSTSRFSCKPDTPQLAQQFLAYARQLNVGVIGFAYDLPGSLVQGLNGFTPTNYADFRCGPEYNNGAGALLHQFFQQHAAP